MVDAMQGGSATPDRDAFSDWLRPATGTLVRQLVEHAPFVIQRRVDLGSGACRLTRHRGATSTSFRVLRYGGRPDHGVSCHVIHLEDVADGEHYILDTGQMGPGFPPGDFALVSP